MKTSPKTFALIVGVLALSGCSDDEANRPYLNISPARKVALDPDSSRVERRQLVASAGNALPAAASTSDTSGKPVSLTALPALPAASLPSIPVAATPEVKTIPAAAVPPHPDLVPTESTSAQVATAVPSAGDLSDSGQCPAAAPEPPVQMWRTTPGLTLREQVRQWVQETNGVYVLEEPSPDSPPDPDWEMTAAETYRGDMPHALGYLKIGFWGPEKPWFVISCNNHILLSTLGNHQ